MSRKRFFILGETCPKEEVESMMGRVVLDYQLPLKAYAPREPIRQEGQIERRHNPQDIIPDILPKPSLTTSRRDFLRQLGGNSASLTMTEYFGINTANSDEEKVELESRTVRKYSLKQPAQYFELLMKDELYERDVRQLLSGSRKGYLVVGFLTTEGTTWNLSSTSSKESGVKFKVPISTGSGGPPELDPSVDLSHKHETGEEHSYSTAETEVFAVAYDVVRISHAFDKTATYYIRRDIEHGPAKRVRARHLVLGGESSGSDMEAEEEDLFNKDDNEIFAETSEKSDVSFDVGEDEC
ncbi:hypothetical protein LTR56_019312 [Elasticomyces elasticus]|nr:hypothetical protein LTR56_019312 [Elasticomyces elasticus]KAK3635325.1 hypothetical protein LTR22_019253 [Elasticomyces elasticus]KAK5734885.1 hypothetical protein LTS12_026601 [Elasticomyces elasticus]